VSINVITGVVVVMWSMEMVVTQEKVVASRALVQPGEGMGGREEGRKSGSFFFQVSAVRVMSYHKY
jgi:hypothetical protein